MKTNYTLFTTILILMFMGASCAKEKMKSPKPLQSQEIENYIEIMGHQEQLKKAYFRITEDKISPQNEVLQILLLSEPSQCHLGNPWIQTDAKTGSYLNLDLHTKENTDINNIIFKVDHKNEAAFRLSGELGIYSEDSELKRFFFSQGSILVTSNSGTIHIQTIDLEAFDQEKPLNPIFINFEYSGLLKEFNPETILSFYFPAPKLD